MAVFTYLQQYAYNVMNLGYNVCITGDAGTGKSYTLLKFIDYQESLGKNIMKLAPTGIAAANINGVTAHKEFGIPVGPLTNKYDSYNDIDDNLLETDILILEEISMCRVDLFDYIANKVLRANNIRKNRGKATIQFIVSGDFFQLPPVITEYDKVALDKFYKCDIGAGFAFQSKFWSMFEFKYIILLEVIRQNNKEFMNNLNKVRVGDKSGIQYFYDNSCKYEIEGAITLCGKNSEVREVNKRELDKLPGEIVEYRAILDGDVNYNDTIAEFNLEIKIGARVMTLVNSDYYNNGSFGIVIGTSSEYITVKMDSGIAVIIPRYTWEIYKYDLEEDDKGKQKLIRKVAGTFTQFPIKPAYAITIHKSQGQTYDYVNLSPYCWDCGQLYTALSRVRSIENMYIKYDISSDYAVTSLNVIKFYNNISKIANQTITEPFKREISKIKDNDIANDMDLISNLLRSK